MITHLIKSLYIQNTYFFIDCYDMLYVAFLLDTLTCIYLFNSSVDIRSMPFMIVSTSQRFFSATVLDIFVYLAFRNHRCLSLYLSIFCIPNTPSASFHSELCFVRCMQFDWTVGWWMWMGSDGQMACSTRFGEGGADGAVLSFFTMVLLPV